MIVYPHPLDYVSGLKYAVTSKKLPVEYKPSPETFHVLELVDLGSAGFNTKRGEYAVLKLWKRGIDTFKALETISKKLDVPVSNILFYGIKDKYACTESYVFVKSRLLDLGRLPISMNNLQLELVGFTRIKPTRKMFKGNKFKVIIDVNKATEVKALLEEIIGVILETGLPAYYGYQRFGWRRYNSHLLGKYILLKREDLFAEEFLQTPYLTEDFENTAKRVLGKYEDLLYEYTYVGATLGGALEAVVKKVHNILLDAYSSYLFNLLINTLVEKQGLNTLYRDLPMPGCPGSQGYYEGIFRVEGVNWNVLRNLDCSHRRGLFKPLNIVLECRDSIVVYEFTLEPGMYATVVLRELFKDNLLLP